jgi:hypothetical protein
MMPSIALLRILRLYVAMYYVLRILFEYGGARMIVASGDMCYKKDSYNRAGPGGIS